MKHSKIGKVFAEIKTFIMKGKTNSAIERLGEFISALNDELLENQIVSLSSRFNRFNREKIQGTISEENRIELNSIDANLMNLLREAKQVAIEEASISVGEQLSELAQEGENAIDELKKLTLIMAESRLLELRVFRSYLGSVFSEKDVKSFDKNINALKRVLGKEGEIEEEDGIDINPDLMSKMQQLQENFSPNDMAKLMNRFIGK